MILRNEIEHPLFKDSGLQIDVLNKIVAMLGVNFTDEEDRKTSAVEWVNFVSQYKLTAPEILEAYNKTLRRELRNENNEVIRIFPNLSLISAGEILNAFIEFKKNSKIYEKATEELKLLLNQPIEKTEEELEEIRRLNFEKIIQLVKEGREKEVNTGFLLFEHFLKSGKLKEVLPTKEEHFKMCQDKMIELVGRERLNPIFFTKHELKILDGMIQRKEVLPVHNIVKMKIRDEIIVRLAKKEIKK